MPSSAFGAAERIRLGHIGVRNQGTNNLKAFLGKKDAEVVAVCDVDKEVLAAAKKLAEEKTGKSIATFGDYRKLLDDKSIDAVVVTTPDHWHARPTIDACEAGKDVYCEKPLTLFIEEGPAMIAAARKNKRVVQTGSQQRSDARFRRACELVRNGKIGKVKQVLVGLPAVNFDGPAVPDTTPPPELDYDFWLGPAPEKPYNPKHVHYLFRFFWDYSGGQMTNFGAHHLDIAQWGLGRDDSGPVAIEGSATFHPEGWYEVPMTSKITYTYDDGVEVLVEQGTGKYEGGATFVGDRRHHRRHPRQDRGRPGRHPRGRTRPGRRPAVRERQPPPELARLRQEPRETHLRRGHRPPLGDRLPPRQHRRPARPQDPVGPEGREGRRRLTGR